MRRAFVLLCCTLLAAAAAIAQSPGPARVDMAAILGLSGETAAAAMPQNDVTFAASRRTGMEKSTCIANCSPDPYIQCSTASQQSSCTAEDRNCSLGKQGKVVCDGNTTYCPTACPATCTEGNYRYLVIGCCEDDTKERKQQRCVSGGWADTGVITCGGPCGRIGPDEPIIQ